MDTLAAVNEIIKLIVHEEFAPDQPVLQTHCIDSLDLIDVVLAMEKRFGITISGDEVNDDNFTSVRMMAAFIDRKCGTREAAGQ